MQTARWAIAAFLIAGAGLAERTKEEKPAPAPEAEAVTRAQSQIDRETETPLIGHLETRNYLISVRAGEEDEPLYTIRKKDGEVVVEDRSVDDLRAEHPALHDMLEGAIAGEATLDASVRRPPARAW